MVNCQLLMIDYLLLTLYHF